MAATARALRLVVASSRSSSRPAATHRSLLAAAHRRLLSASTTTESAGPGDAAVHSGDAPSDDYTDRPPRFSGADAAATKSGHGGKHAPPAPTGGKECVPPFAPSGNNKLGSQEEFADPAGGGAASFTQKRRLSSSSGSGGGEEAAARKVREEDREYYRTHKPSPLAELEFADTRKPITRATDGGGGGADDVPARVVEDTADDSLARAEAMFREAASRGNPEWPHSRALAEMLARRQHQGDGGAASRESWGS
ncbi:unnamed protein product [Urochloa humidicola]